MTEKLQTAPSSRALTIVSFREVASSPSHSVIEQCEDALNSAAGNSRIVTIRKVESLLARVLRHPRLKKTVIAGRVADTVYRTLQSLLSRSTESDVLYFCLNTSDLDLVGSHRSHGGLIMVYVIDAWESRIDRVAQMIPSIDVLLVAFGHSLYHLERAVPRSSLAKIYLFPVFISDPIRPTPERQYDIIQVGRRDATLHTWCLKYAKDSLRSYLYERRNHQGIYYFDRLPWESKRWQLSYDTLLAVLRQTRIALVSPPDRTNPLRTGSVSPLTHRYLEAASCGAVPVGFTPTGPEYSDRFPDDFTLVPRTYEEFAGICDKLILDREYRNGIAARNYEYVTREHTAQQRLQQLRSIVDAATARPQVPGECH
ncbi:MAG: glycosyltransferase [bacterium]|nr:glycosyltransferase [bacterium]